MAQQPNSGLGHLNIVVSGSHTIKQTYPVELWMQVVSQEQWPLPTQHTIKHYTRTYVPSAGFKPIIPATKPLQTYTTGISRQW